MTCAQRVLYNAAEERERFLRVERNVLGVAKRTPAQAAAARRRKHQEYGLPSSRWGEGLAHRDPPPPRPLGYMFERRF